jgi:VIT1/CCC1 family predicted Fe2+/Mn2+ transporter
MNSSEGTSAQAKRRGETEEERLDRNLAELLQELRVAIPGIQIIFAFLLVVPFQQGWASISDTEKGIYYGTLLCTTGATVLLIAPTARHRMRFRGLDKEWIVMSSHRLAIGGLAFLALAITGVVLLISLVVYDSTLAAIVTPVVLALLTWFWFIAPLQRGGGKDGGD